uniref:Glycosyl transferase family 1 domain-containing protein n=1 Tax=Ciona savignyi TaxID=51511 RepID=H2YN98_CIOSA
MPRVVIISPMPQCSGNTSTAQRLAEHFMRNNIDCCLMTPTDFVSDGGCSVESLNKTIRSKSVDGLILLHAVKSGICLSCRCVVPCKLLVKFGIVFGGTDLNEHGNNEAKLVTLRSVIKLSTFCVAFTEDLRNIALNIVPDVNVLVQPQAVGYDLFEVRCEKGGVDSGPVVFVLPCNIRPVKNPLFLVEKFWEWGVGGEGGDVRKDVRLLILGDVLDDDFAVEFLAKLEEMKEKYGTRRVNNSPSDKQTNLETCFAVVNCSFSEGMASSVLEGMMMGLPVLAADIPGNRAVITHNIDGCLFSTPDQFISQATKLINNGEFRTKITSAAKSKISTNHDPYKEAEFYVNLVTK